MSLFTFFNSIIFKISFLHSGRIEKKTVFGENKIRTTYRFTHAQDGERDQKVAHAFPSQTGGPRHRERSLDGGICLAE